MTNRSDEDQDLDRLAGAILDGDRVDWGSAASRPDAAGLLEQLRIVAAIADAHRTPDSEAESVGPRTWGHLTLLRQIGHGTSGEVFLAIDNRLQRPVALKLLFPEFSKHTGSRAAIEEACLLAKIRHPNVVTVFGAEWNDKRVGIITEHIDGTTLADIVRQQGSFGAQEAMTIGVDLCRALSAVHHAGLVHRDVKAHNVMRENGGRIVLMDLGAGSRALGGEHGLAGTPLYAAPETLDGHTGTPQSDIYSLGVLLYHLVTGAYPVVGNDLDAIRNAHRHGRRTLLHDARPGLPPAFTAVVDRALQADPAARYQTAGEMKAALLGALNVPAATGWAPRGRAAWAGGAIVGALALVAAVTAASIGWRSRTEGPPTIPFESRQWVLLVPFENQTGNPAFDGVLEHAFHHALSTSAHMNVVPPERVEDALRLMKLPTSLKLGARLGREVAARDGNVRVILTGSIARIGDRYPITVSVIDPATGGVLASQREDALAESAIPEGIRRLSAWVRLTLGETSQQVAESTRSLAKATTPSLSALRHYSEAMTATRNRSWALAEAFLKSALAEDPDFASAQIWLAWAQINLSRQKEALLSAERAVTLARSATDRERHFILGSAALLRGDHSLAATEFEALLALYPDDFWAQHKVYDAYSGTRSREEIRSVALRAADARPNDPVTQLRAASEMLRAGLAGARPYFARSRALVEAAGDDALPLQEQLYLRLFPAFDLWTQRRIGEAEKIMQSVRQDTAAREGGDWSLSPFVTFHLSLGQPRAAENLALQMRDPHVRAMTRAFVALARDDVGAIPPLLAKYGFYDLAPVSLLIRARRFDAAQRLLSSLPVINPVHAAATAAEVQVARGNLGPRRTLESAIELMRFEGARSFLYTETLAEGLTNAGDRMGAIELLKAQVSGGDRAFSRVNHVGYLWMRCATKLADLYRAGGRIDDARRIEGDVLAALARAEPDFPLLLELRRRTAQ